MKRFIIETQTQNKMFLFISEASGSRLDFVSTIEEAMVEIDIFKGKGKSIETHEINVADFIDIKGWKSIGNRLSNHKIKKIRPLINQEEQEDVEDVAEVNETEDDNEGQEKEEVTASTKKKKTSEEDKSVEDTDETKKDLLPARKEKPSGKSDSKKDNNKKGGDESFGIGTTIELDF